jgi:hypothetical protein
VAEVGMIEARAQQIAALQLDRKQLAAIEMTEREVAADEAGFTQLAEGESRTDWCGLVGEDAVRETCAAKVGMRETTADETATEEALAIALGVLPFDLREVRVFDRQSLREGSLKLDSCHLFPLIQE